MRRSGPGDTGRQDTRCVPTSTQDSEGAGGRGEPLGGLEAFSWEAEGFRMCTVTVTGQGHLPPWTGADLLICAVGPDPD